MQILLYRVVVHYSQEKSNYPMDGFSRMKENNWIEFTLLFNSKTKKFPKEDFLHFR